MKPRIYFLMLALAFPTIPATADTVSGLTDGRPWTATLGNGRSMKMTLNPNGSGKISFGIISRTIAWAERDGQICLSGMPRTDGPRCSTPVRVDGGYQLTNADGQKMRLSR